MMKKQEMYEMKNGMRVHLVPISGTKAVTVLVLSKVGSRYETKELSGASHFIEHLMFKGTKRRPNTIDISKALDSVGAQYNAYTGKNLTGYYVKIDAQKTDLAIDILHDMIFHSTHDPVELDRERNVVIEEINMYEDNPMRHVEDLLEEKFFEGNPLGWEIAGTHETMKAMKREDIIAYRDKFYIPKRMVVVVSGAVPTETKKLLEKTFGSVESKKDENTFIPFSFVKKKPESILKLQFKKTEQMHLAWGFPSYAIGDEKNKALTLLSVIFGETMSSRLFISVRERKGLAYMIKSGNAPYDDVGMFTIHAGLDPSRLKLAVKTIEQEIKLIRTKGITDKELKEAKDHLKGQMALQMESSSFQAEWYGNEELFLKKKQTPEEYLKKMEKITKKQVNDVAKEVLQEKGMRLSVIGPFENEKAFWDAVR